MQIPPRQTRKSPAQGDTVTTAELRRWRGRSGLIYLVREAVEEVDWPHKKEKFAIHPELSFDSEKLMTLEVYCYARGVYSSEGVEEIVMKERDLRPLFPEQWPDPRTILKYRRLHREPILDCLRHVFRKAFVIRFGEPGTDPVPIDHCVAMALDRWFEPICGPQPENEAAERIDRAIFWDGMAEADRHQ